MERRKKMNKTLDEKYNDLGQALVSRNEIAAKVTTLESQLRVEKEYLDQAWALIDRLWIEIEALKKAEG